MQFISDAAHALQPNSSPLAIETLRILTDSGKPAEAMRSIEQLSLADP